MWSETFETNKCTNCLSLPTPSTPSPPPPPPHSRLCLTAPVNSLRVNKRFHAVYEQRTRNESLEERCSRSIFRAAKNRTSVFLCSETTLQYRLHKYLPHPYCFAGEYKGRLVYRRVQVQEVRFHLVFIECDQVCDPVLYHEIFLFAVKVKCFISFKKIPCLFKLLQFGTRCVALKLDNTSEWSLFFNRWQHTYIAIYYRKYRRF